jgi:hypothetical protein
MCIAFCHKRRVLFFTHEDCPPLQCRWSNPALWGRCGDCRHRRDGRCGLTNAPLPVPGGGCCHWNVPLVDGKQVVGAEEVQLLPAFGVDQAAVEVLDSYGVWYELDSDGRPLVDPDELVLPLMYGRGSEPAGEDDEMLLWLGGEETADFW